MYITQIEVSDLQIARDNGRVQGFVSFEGATGHVQMHCAVSAATPRGGRDALVTEAIRQLGRMPEYRAGRKSLSFAPELTRTDLAVA